MVGFSWFQVNFHGFSWFQVGFSWFQVSFHGFTCSRLGFYGFRLAFLGPRLVFHGSRLVFHGSWFHIYAQICPIGAPRSLVVPGLGGLKKIKVSQVPPPFNVKSDTIPMYFDTFTLPCLRARSNQLCARSSSSSGGAQITKVSIADPPIM